MVNGKAGFAVHDLGDSKKVKNFYIVSQFLATGEGWRRRDTSQEEENKNFQVIFLVSSEFCLLTLDNSQSLDLNP